MIITVDTNVLIWGLRGVASQGQQAMIPRARSFLEWVDDQGHEVVLTSVAVGEYLVRDAGPQRDAELVQISRCFKVAPYDTRAARIAAELRSHDDFWMEQTTTPGKTRVAIKADIMVAATAKAHGIDRVYSHDTGLRNCAKRISLDALDLPALPAPGLFSDDDFQD